MVRKLLTSRQEAIWIGGANKIAYQEYRGYQWTSNPGTTGAYYFYYNNANLNFTGLDRASAASVRCVRIE